MPTKVYKAKSKITVPIIVGNKIKKYIEFTDENHTFTTKCEETQKALESSPAYKKYYSLYRTVATATQANQSVNLSGQSQDTEQPNNQEWTTFEHVTNWQTAKEILRAAPYSIPYQSIANPDAICRKAEELKIKFPNLPQP